MTIRKEIEAKIVAVLRTLLGDAATVTGFLESVGAGEVKNVVQGRPEVAVTVSPGEAPAWAVPEMEFPVTVVVRLDLEDDPSQAAFDQICEPIENLMQTWQLDRNWSEVSEALGVPRFRIDGFRATGGRDTFDASRENPSLSTSFTFAIQGVLQPQGD